jgi:hypothetical protein
VCEGMWAIKMVWWWWWWWLLVVQQKFKCSKDMCFHWMHLRALIVFWCFDNLWSCFDASVGALIKDLL